MQNFYRRLLILPIFIISIFLQSCSIGESGVNIVDGIVPTNTNESYLIEKTQIMMGTQTVVRSVTPTSKRLPLSYDLPNWFSNFDDTILMMVTDVSKSSSQITFVNANLSEHFDIWVQNAEMFKYFWTTDGKAFGFLERNKQFVYLVNVQTGEVLQYELDSHAQQCLEEYLSRRGPENIDVIEPMWVYGESPESPGFFCEPGNRKGSDKYNIEYGEDQTYTESIRITELESGHISEINVADPINGLYLINSNWRENPQILAVLQGDVADTELLDIRWRYSLAGDRILLFDLSTGNLINSFEGEYKSLYWSPDNTKIFARKGYMPCVIDITRNEIECLELNRAQEHSIPTDLFNWSKDSQQIYYAKNNNRGDICIYDLPSDEIFCPTSGLDILDDLNIEYYKMSYDDQFFIFSYGYSCSGCDYWGEPSSGIINRDGNNFYFLGDERIEYHFPFNSTLVRPLTE